MVTHETYLRVNMFDDGEDIKNIFLTKSISSRLSSSSIFVERILSEENLNTGFQTEWAKKG